MGKWGHSNRGSACKTPEPLPEQLQNCSWNGKKWVFPPTRRGGKGWGLQGHPHLQELAGRLTGLSTCLCAHSRDGSQCAGDARVGGSLLQSPHDPSCPLLPSRVSRVSLPPVTKGRTMTVTPVPVPPGKLIRDLAPGWNPPPLGPAPALGWFLTYRPALGKRFHIV